MSKMDNLRAMREARYAAAQARTTPAAPATRPTRAAAAARPPVAPDEPAPAAAGADPEPGDELCGHRNMGGRSCTREKGHTAKSHRYS